MCPLTPFSREFTRYSDPALFREFSAAVTAPIDSFSTTLFLPAPHMNAVLPMTGSTLNTTSACFPSASMSIAALNPAGRSITLPLSRWIQQFQPAASVIVDTVKLRTGPAPVERRNTMPS